MVRDIEVMKCPGLDAQFRDQMTKKILGSFQDLMTLNGKRDFSEINHSYFD